MQPGSNLEIRPRRAVAEQILLPVLWLAFVFFTLLAIAFVFVSREKEGFVPIVVVGSISFGLAALIVMLQGRGARIQQGRLTVWRMFRPRTVEVREIAAAEDAVHSVRGKAQFTPRKIWVWPQRGLKPLPIYLHSMRRKDADTLSAWLRGTAAHNQAQGIRRPTVRTLRCPPWTWFTLALIAVIGAAVLLGSRDPWNAIRVAGMFAVGGWLLDRCMRGAADFDALEFRHRTLRGRWRVHRLSEIHEVTLAPKWPATLHVRTAHGSIAVPVHAGDITMARAFAEDLSSSLAARGTLRVAQPS